MNVQNGTELKAVSIDSIRLDGGTQLRVELNEEVIEEYGRAMLEGIEFPPVDVFFDGKDYWLADGFHRFYAVRKTKGNSIQCRIRQGTIRDAVVFAAGANAKHGLPRNNADKRRATATLLRQSPWSFWSDNRIAEVVGVSVPFVSRVRKELLTVNSPSVVHANGQPREGRDGRLRALPANIPSRPASVSINSGEPQAADQARDVRAERLAPDTGKAFSKASALFGELIRAIDGCELALGPEFKERRLKSVADMRTSLDLAYRDFQKWKMEVKATKPTLSAVS